MLPNEKIIRKIRKIRTKNNKEWEHIFLIAGTPIAANLHQRRIKANYQLMRILASAFKRAPKISRKIIKNVIANDKRITAWMSRLH